MSTLLVTGVNGFVGQHLVRELKSQGHKVIGTGLNPDGHPGIKNLVDAYIGDCDLTNHSDIKKLPYDDIQSIINLAGLAKVGNSFGNDDLYYRVNVNAHTLIAEEIWRRQAPVRMLSISSGAIYDHDQPMPLTEKSHPLTKGSPYSLSKLRMEQKLFIYQNRGLDIIIARPFNHIGPGQSEGFLLPDLFSQLRESSQNDQSIRVGNLQTKRDFTDVRDVANAYIKLALAEKSSLSSNIYNICSGTSVSGNTILKHLIKACGMPSPEIQQDPQKMRPIDALDIFGSYSLLNQDTGWYPQIKLEQSIGDFVDYASSQ